MNEFALREILALAPDEFSAAFKGSPMKRAKVRGMKRNASVVLGNVGTVEDVEVLTRALADPEPLVCEHAAWAIQRIGASTTRAAPHTVQGRARDEAAVRPRLPLAD